MKKKNTELLIKEKDVLKIVRNEELSKSERMKRLFDEGFEIKKISELMNVRYNFVYNVCSNYVNINDIEVVKEKKESKRSIIIKEHLEGKTNSEISKLLKTNYNYVYKVVKEYKVLNEEKVVNKK